MIVNTEQINRLHQIIYASITKDVVIEELPYLLLKRISMVAGHSIDVIQLPHNGALIPPRSLRGGPLAKRFIGYCKNCNILILLSISPSDTLNKSDVYHYSFYFDKERYVWIMMDKTFVKGIRYNDSNRLIPVCKKLEAFL